MTEIIKCKAAVAWAPNTPMTIETVEVAPPREGEVRIKMLSASICHTDLSNLSGMKLPYPKPNFPVVPGHEGAGIVESVGDGVTSLQPGDAVLPIAVPYCGSCALCTNGDSESCLTMLDNIGDGLIGRGDDKAPRLTCDGKPIFHCLGISSFSQYTVCRESSVVKVNKSMPFDQAAPISCGIITGYGAAVNSAGVKKGSSCAVWGLGTVGLAAVIGCKMSGANKIVAIDTNPAKFDVAKKLGATDCLNPSNASFADAFMKVTDGEGVDFALECVGNTDILKQAVETSNKYWGKTVVIGAGTGELKLTNAIQFIFGRSLIGSLLGGKDRPRLLQQLVELYLQGKIPVEEFISHRLNLASINDGFELIKAKKCVKCVINMW